MDHDNELSPEEFGMFLISHVKQVRNHHALYTPISSCQRCAMKSEMDTWVDRVSSKLQDIEVRSHATIKSSIISIQSMCRDVYRKRIS